MAGIMTEGFEIIHGVMSPSEIADIVQRLPELQTQAGTRNLLAHDWCRCLAADPRILGPAQRAIGVSAKPVRGILFDKTPGANWNLGWHQDKKIAVKRRVDSPGYFAWSEKEGSFIAKRQPLFLRLVWRRGFTSTIAERITVRSV